MSTKRKKAKSTKRKKTTKKRKNNVTRTEHKENDHTGAMTGAVIGGMCGHPILGAIVGSMFDEEE
jgi:uncharacterized protein YcfJ